MKDYKRKNGRRVIRDYNRRSYGNPLFRQSPRVRSKTGIDVTKAKRIGLLAIGAALLLFLGWYLLWSPSFRITNVEISGASPETESTIRGLIDSRFGQRRALVLPQTSVFMFDTDGAKKDIADVFYFGSLEVKKRLPDTLVIDVSEKDMVATFLAGSRFVAVDADGYVIRDLTERESLMMNDLPDGLGAVVAGELGAEAVDIDDIIGHEESPEELKRNENPTPLIIEKGNEETPIPGESVVGAEALSLILQCYAALPEVTGAGIRWFTVDPASDTIDVTLKSGWSVYLTTLLPFDVQRDRLSLVLKEKIGDRRAELEYVDLRYDERIFFRFRESEDES